MLRPIAAALLFAFLGAWTADIQAALAPTPQAEEQQALAILNAYRTSQGLPVLTQDDRLTGIADRLAHACATAEGACDHNTGGSFAERMKAAGYKVGYGAENVRKNEATMEGAFNWWKGSQVHNSNMLMKPLKAAGFAHRTSPNGRGIWVLIMGD